MKNPLLAWLRNTSVPRYRLVYQNTEQVDLDMWHDAYKQLAEPYLRKRVQKKTKKIFGYMKKMEKVKRVLETKLALNVDQKIGISAGRKFTIGLFVEAANTDKMLITWFKLTFMLGFSPPIINTEVVSKGFSGKNIDAAYRFSQFIKEEDSGDKQTINVLDPTKGEAVHTFTSMLSLLFE